MNGRKVIAYRRLGMPVCLNCDESFDQALGKKIPVHTDELPADLYVQCAVCDTPILPDPCPFCEIIGGRAPVDWVIQPDYWPDAVAFIPLERITEDHCLIAPKVHVRDFAQEPEVFAAIARRAAELMRFTPRPMNLVTTRGREAGQEIFHLHLHLIPREAGDGIRLISKKGKK